MTTAGSGSGGAALGNVAATTMAGGGSGATTLGRGISATLGSVYGNNNAAATTTTNNGSSGDILGRAVSTAQEAVAATMMVTACENEIFACGCIGRMQNSDFRRTLGADSGALLVRHGSLSNGERNNVEKTSMPLKTLLGHRIVPHLRRSRRASPHLFEPWTVDNGQVAETRDE
uniref:Uncharacterized protein n=1 Tax=Oryza meridionalis TaxID=40149 RepID=A0A0E0EJN4_9ORYZ